VVAKVRLQRINDRIREELSEILLQDISDPRLSGISVTDVEVDRELAYAQIYISALEGSERWPDIQEGLQHANSYLRHELSQRIELRVFPRLRFRWDPTVERAERIEQLIVALHNNDSQVNLPHEAQEEPTGEEETDDAG
jgi:ribosome-binding factor A